MAHSIVTRRFNIPFTYIGNDYHDGEDMIKKPETIVHGYSVNQQHVIVDYKGTEYKSGTQIYLSGDVEINLTIVGGEYMVDKWGMRNLIRGVAHYPKRYSRNADNGIGLVVLYL